MNKNLIIMFIKEPKLGFVKTRLACTIGNEVTLDLYKCFVKDLITTLEDTAYDFTLCTYGDTKIIKETFGSFNNYEQEQGDLGIKMSKAFETQFESYENIVLIGSDTPYIQKETFEDAFVNLHLGKTVIGPSSDGGYYLIAFTRKNFNKELFKDITWSTSSVLEQTLQKVNKKELYLLKELNDIDIYEDLSWFYTLYKDSYFSSSQTITFLKDKNICKTMM